MSAKYLNERAPTGNVKDDYLIHWAAAIEEDRHRSNTGALPKPLEGVDRLRHPMKAKAIDRQRETTLRISNAVSSRVIKERVHDVEVQNDSNVQRLYRRFARNLRPFNEQAAEEIRELARTRGVDVHDFTLAAFTRAHHDRQQSGTHVNTAWEIAQRLHDNHPVIYDHRSDAAGNPDALRRIHELFGSVEDRGDIPTTVEERPPVVETESPLGFYLTETMHPGVSYGTHGAYLPSKLTVTVSAIPATVLEPYQP